MERTDRENENRRPQQAALLAFVATTWFAQLPLIVGWSAMLESGDPGVGLGWLTWLAVLASPVVGWAFAKNISELGVEHAQRPAFAATILVAAVWLGGLHVHLTAAWWLGQCEAASNADACLAAGDYFDGGDAVLQGTIDAKKLWVDACEGGGEHGWKACRKLVHRVGYKKIACNSLRDHCHADERNIGACWDWSVVCDRKTFVDEEVDRLLEEQERSEDESGAESESDGETVKSDGEIAGRAEQVDDYQRCLKSRFEGVSPACDRTLDRGILHQREAVCSKLESSCSTKHDWPCEFAITRCDIFAASPFD